jgi:thiol-disulfide isomerase/thioredoxin
MMKKKWLLCLPVFVALTACGSQDVSRVPFNEVIIADAEIVKKSIADKIGNVVLVNFWATWCEPCTAEFPDIVKLYNKYRNDGLDVITISYDFEDQIESQVLPYLKSEKAEFTNLIQGEDVVDQDFLLAIDPELKGVLPTTLLYDRQGIRQHIIFGQFETNDLEQKIVDLLEN